MKSARDVSQPESSKNHDQGAILVEVAMILPLLAIMLLIIVDLGLLVREHQVIQNAAREGARFSAQPANQISPLNPAANEANIRQRVMEYCQEENITVNATAISIDQNYPIPMGGGLTARGSEITITYSRPLLITGGGFLPTGPLTLSGNSIFRNLY